MPGPIPINERNIKALSEIAYQDENGNWHAGPDAKGYTEGQFVDSTYAKQARSQRKRTNLVKANMRKQEMSEGEARDFVNEKLDEIREEKRSETPDEDRITELRQQLHGSG